MSQAPHIQDLLAMRRRTLLAGLAGLPLLSLSGTASAQAPAPRLPAFTSLGPDVNDSITVPAGYRVQTLVGWGDALFDSVAPRADLSALTRAEQEQRWGTNNDMLAIFPASFAFPPAREGDRFILCANNEYADPNLMLPGIGSLREITAAQGEAVYASMGVSVVQVERQGDAWRIVREAAPRIGATNRRITPFTPVVFSGPAARHPWIEAAGAFVNAKEPGKAHEPNPPGAIRCGTYANCAGGTTPWGTYLSSEENFNFNFFNTDPDSEALAPYAADAGYVLDAANFGYAALGRSAGLASPEQWDLAKNPTGPALYGWVVEVDPYDGTAAPVKRTALGRKKGECATTAIGRNGRVAVYMGDDQANEFLYKFVSRDRFDPANRAANKNLLDNGKLYVARMEVDGAGTWMELTPRAANRAARDAGSPIRFANDGDVRIRAREAARLMGATPLDRPEDVEALLDENWVGQGPVLVVCTNNREQDGSRPGAPNREGSDGVQSNLAGHILRLDEDGGCAAATRFRWDVFALGGDPDAQTPTVRTPGGATAYVSTHLNGAPLTSGARFACPDNLCIDRAHNVWIATDGSDAVFGDCNDSILVMPAHATGPKPVKRFLVGPVGAEMCGPTMAPDERAFLCAIQHPGESDATGVSIQELRWVKGQRPPSSFPDGGDAWPRSAVVVVTKEDGGLIGS